MSDPRVRYRSHDEDSGRWEGFAFRRGDIVISTRSKSGTTWMQMICALLVLQRPDLPQPLAELSPWMDWLLVSRQETHDLLHAQEHRRLIKTHTPLDGVPLDDRVTYIVMGRHPLDMAVSLYHQGDNLNRERMRALAGRPTAEHPPAERPLLRDWLVAWVERDGDPRTQMDSLPGVMSHMTDAWSRRDEPNVILVRYNDLESDLAGEMRSLAARLSIEVPEDLWPILVEAATFESMSESADVLAPDPVGILRNKATFFLRGRSGAGQETLSPTEIARYHERVAELAPADLLSWLHHDSCATD